VAQEQLRRLRGDLLHANWDKNEDLSGLDKKAVASGASKLIVSDLREEFLQTTFSPPCRRRGL